MADKTTTTFPKVGKLIASHITAAPVIKGRSVTRKNASGGFAEAATATHRANIKETLGASWHPTATLYKANAAEASMTLRNTRIVPSQASLGDFYLRRGYGQKS